MNIGSLLFFVFTCLGLGFLIDIFVPKWKADILEKVVMRFGVGLAAFSVLGIILNLLHIPLYWLIFLFIAFLIAGIAFWYRPSVYDVGVSKKFYKQKWFIYSLIAVILFFNAGMMYMQGTFGYSWMEDGDPWVYTAVTKNIADDMTFTADYKQLHYTEPYTQGYQIVLGMVTQTADSVYWVMKFFTTLVLGFSILFFYFFARRLTENEDHAILATIFLWAMPAWLGHFIYSLNWNMVIFVVLLYPLVLSFDDKPKKWCLGWRWPLAIAFASLWINHFYTAMAGTLLILIFYIVRVLTDEDLHTNVLQGLVGGVLLSLLFYIPSYARHWHLVVPGKLGFGGVEELFPLLLFLTSTTGLITLILAIALISALYYYREVWFKPIKTIIKPRGTKLGIYIGSIVAVLIVLLLPFKFFESFGSGSRIYTLGDFFIATSQNMINNPISVGWVIMSLFCIGLVLALLNIKKLIAKNNANLLVIFTLGLATLLIVNSMRFSITFVPFRMWTFFAIFCALLAAFPVAKALGGLKNNLIVLGIIIVIGIAVIPTSHSAKVEYNTALWPDQEIIVPESQALFQWMRDGGIPKDSRVFRMCASSYPFVAYDMSSELTKIPAINPGIEPGTPYYSIAMNETADENLAFFRQHKIEYVVIGSSCLVKGSNEDRIVLAQLINPKMDELITHPSFSVVRVSQSPEGTPPERQAVELLFKVE